MITKKSLFVLLAFILPVSMSAQKKQNVKTENRKLYELNQIDLHVHAGKERPVAMNDWIDLFVNDGRKVLLLLDHLELYRTPDKENEVRAAKDNVTNWYPDSATARMRFINDLNEVTKRKDVLIFKGWEIWEGELDEGLEKEPMKYAEVIGWHISKAAWDGKAPSGKEIIQRTKQILEVQKEFPVPMIVFHPFAGYYEQVKSNAIKSGRKALQIKKEEYRYFTPEEQKELIRLVKGKSVYFEIGRNWENLWDDIVMREAFIEDIKPLADAGVKFTVSSDAHNKSSFNKLYQPEKYCIGLGITPENVNSIIEELLAIRNRKKL